MAVVEVYLPSFSPGDPYHTTMECHNHGSYAIERNSPYIVSLIFNLTKTKDKKTRMESRIGSFMSSYLAPGYLIVTISLGLLEPSHTSSQSYCKATLPCHGALLLMKTQ
uniref:Uncharacterized protein n=1 Tax=Coccidioides posadasii RMSCC 3488 TaxID=454284 RepID=A0A0J6FJK4_COCPO|nr:hypothetical protein CPAG_05900 [Coccidioides posadasii RMSCC 3488]